MIIFVSEGLSAEEVVVFRQQKFSPGFWAFEIESLILGKFDLGVSMLLV